MAKRICDLKLVLFHTTEKAYIAGPTEDRDEAVALPMSLVELGDQCGSVKGYPIHEFQIPENLAIEKELI